MKRIVLVVLLALTLFSCRSKDTVETESPKSSEHMGLKYVNSWKASDDSITFMAFNVENLFDTKDDKGKNDATYLPLSSKKNKNHKKTCAPLKNKRWKDQCLNWDWSEKVVDFKLDVLSQTIKQIKGGKGPDILVLEEVENINVLKALNARGLNYPTVVLIEGADKRGIDVAVMTRLEQYKTAQLHPIPFQGFAKERVQDTRGILQVDLKLPGGDIVSVFGVHFPAPFHPKKMREQAFRHLNRLVGQLPKGRLALAGGDFNVPKREDEKGDFVLNMTKDHWVVGHKVACQGCPGTSYYPPMDSWSFLDMILWSKEFENKTSQWKVVKESFRIANGYKEQRSKTGAPNRFEIDGPSGVSDHWPLAVDLKKAK